MWVKGVQVTNFVAGCLFLAYWMLRLTSHHILYRFVKFYYLTYLWLFLDFFSLYPLLIWRESVDRTKWYRNLKFCTLGLYSVSNRYIFPFFWYFESYFRFKRKIENISNSHILQSSLPILFKFHKLTFLLIYKIIMRFGENCFGRAQTSPNRNF